MNENLIFAAVIGLTVYLFMRRLRLLKEQRRQQQQQRVAGAGEPPSTMPRLGTPGTITREQMQELRGNDFQPSRLWSREEAQLILDTVVYLRAVIHAATGEADPPVEIQNSLLRLILSDDEIREHVLDWGLNRTRDEEGEEHPDLPRDEVFAKVERAVLELWED